MYGWGTDDVNTWNKPGYKFDSAKAPYLDKIAASAKSEPRTYSVKSVPKLNLVDPLGKEFTTDSKNPTLWLVDGTGSMQKRPAEIFDRVPLVYQTLAQYKDDFVMGLYVIGDATFDNWPLQVNGFGKGPEIDEQLKAVKAEGGGGPGIRESYELAGYFIDQKVKTPNAVSPIMIIMGDEKFYDKIDPAQVAKYTGDTIQGPIDSLEVWKRLGQKWDIYFLRKPYSGKDKEITAQWEEALGPQRIITVLDDDRTVDHGIGIIAKRWGYLKDFKLNMESRQDSKKVAELEESLKAADIPKYDGKSVMKKSKASKKSVGLLENEKNEGE